MVTVKSFARTFGDRRLDFDYDVCTSHDQAVVKLFRSPPPYQLIISNVRLAAFDNFFLLKHNQALQSFVPFVITADASETVLSRQALEEGAFDHIPTPLEQEQTVSTIRLGLWHGKVKALIASRDRTVERYRQHLANYPGNRAGDAFQTILTSVERSISAQTQTIDRFKRNMDQMERSLESIADFDKAMAKLPREQALERLNRLPK